MDLFRSALGLVKEGGQSDFVGRSIKLDKWQLKVKKSVAEGGFGVVFLVQDESSKEHFALKRMLAFDKGTCKAVSREVSLMKSVQPHENIICLHAGAKAPPEAASKSPTEFLLLMEYCPGGDMGKVLSQRPRLGPSQVLNTFRQACLAVEHLHNREKPIIHRDIKLENLLVGQDGKVKLCDFGSATTKTVCPSKMTYQQICLAEEEMERNTTPQGRTPEMLDMHSGQDINEKADVWALGCVLYHLCFKKHPFEQAQKLAITNAAYSLPEESDYCVFDDLIRILLCTTAKNRPSVTGILERLKTIEKLLVPDADSNLVPLSPTPSSPPSSNEPSVKLTSFFSKAVDGASSLMTTAKAKSQSFVRSGMIKGTNRHGGDAGDLDLTYITPKIIAMSRPADSVTSYRNGVTELCNFFHRRHNSKCLIVNVDDRGYDSSKFTVKVVQFGWKAKRVPSLERLYQMSKAVHEWLSSDPQNIVAFHCDDGKARTGTAIAAYLVYCRLFPSYKDALRLFHLKRMTGGIRVVLPAQERYIAYLGEIIAQRPPHKKAITLTGLTMRSVPTMNTRATGCKPYVEVYSQGEAVLSTFSETLRDYAAGEGSITIPIDVTVLGDVRIVVSHSSSFMGTSNSTEMFSVSFHTGFVQSSPLTYSRSQLEGGNVSKRFDRDFGLKLELEVMRTAADAPTPSWNTYPQSAHAAERAKGRNTCFFSEQEAQQLLNDFAVLARAFSDRVTGSDAGEDGDPQLLSDCEDDLQEATLVEEGTLDPGHGGANMLLDLNDLTAPAAPGSAEPISANQSANSLLDMAFGDSTISSGSSTNAVTADLMDAFSSPPTPLQQTFGTDLLGAFPATSTTAPAQAAPASAQQSTMASDMDMFMSQPTTPASQPAAPVFPSNPLQAPPSPSPSGGDPDPFGGDPFATLGSMAGLKPKSNNVPMGQMPQQQQVPLMQQQQQRMMGGQMGPGVNMMQQQAPMMQQPMMQQQYAPQMQQKPQPAMQPQATANVQKPVQKNQTPAKPQSAGFGLGEILNDHFNFSAKQSDKEPGTLKDMVREQKLKTEDPIKVKVEEWMEGKKNNIRAVLSTLHEVLWEGTKWKPLQLHELLSESQVKKGYQKAVRVIHPDKNRNSDNAQLAQELFYSVQESYERWEEAPTSL